MLRHLFLNPWRYTPLEEQRFFVGDEVFQKASFGMVDSGFTAEHLRFVAVPRLPGVKVCVVAQRLLIRRQAHVAHSSFRQGAQAEQALEKHSIGPLPPQPLQHVDGLTWVHQCNLHLCRPHPEQWEKGRIKSIPVVQHLSCYTCSKLRGVQSGQKEIPTVALGTTLEVMHLDKDFQLITQMPLLSSIGGKDGEQAAPRVTCQGQGSWCRARRRPRPGKRFQQVALFQFILRGGFLAQLGTEGVVVIKCRQISWD